MSEVESKRHRAGRLASMYQQCICLPHGLAFCSSLATCYCPILVVWTDSERFHWRIIILICFQPFLHVAQGSMQGWGYLTTTPLSLEQPWEEGKAEGQQMVQHHLERFSAQAKNQTQLFWVQVQNSNHCTTLALFSYISFNAYKDIRYWQNLAIAWESPTHWWKTLIEKNFSRESLALTMHNN